MTHYLKYWKPETVIANENMESLDHSASDQYDRVAIGDVLWIVTSEGPDDLVLVGRQRVDRIVSQTQAEAILGTSWLWEARYHAISNQPQPVVMVDISLYARRLGFEGTVEYLPEGFTGQHLQAMRRLDFESSGLLERLYAQAIREAGDD